MRRFHYEDNDDFQDEVDQFFSDEIDFDENEYAQVADLVQAASLELVSYDLNQRLLQLSVNIAEKSLFWRFKSIEKKLESIATIYLSLKSLVEEEEGLFEEDENQELTDEDE